MLFVGCMTIASASSSERRRYQWYPPHCALVKIIREIISFALPRERRLARESRAKAEEQLVEFRRL